MGTCSTAERLHLDSRHSNLDICKLAQRRCQRLSRICSLNLEDARRRRQYTMLDLQMLFQSLQSREERLHTQHEQRDSWFTGHGDLARWGRLRRRSD